MPTKKASPAVTSTEPKFPYTTKPSSLRRLLKEIPSKPRPPKIDQALLKSWGFADNNDMTTLRVLKAVDFLNDRNEPTDKYTAFMNVGEGGKALGPEVRRVYAPFFQASHAPYNESNERLENLLIFIQVEEIQQSRIRFKHSKRFVKMRSLKENSHRAAAQVVPIALLKPLPLMSALQPPIPHPQYISTFISTFRKISLVESTKILSKTLADISSEEPHD